MAFDIIAALLGPLQAVLGPFAPVLEVLGPLILIALLVGI
jgi:hypothetical protein